MTHDYKRDGTTTLFAALNVKTGERAACNASEFESDLPRWEASNFVRHAGLPLGMPLPRPAGRPLRSETVQSQQSGLFSSEDATVCAGQLNPSSRDGSKR